MRFRRYSRVKGAVRLLTLNGRQQNRTRQLSIPIDQNGAPDTQGAPLRMKARTMARAGAVRRLAAPGRDVKD